MKVPELNPRPVRLAAALALGLLLAVGGGVRAAAPTGSELSWDQREKIVAPVGAWAGEVAKEKNAAGASLKKVAYSRLPRRVDDVTYTVTAHVNTAGDSKQTTERYRLTLKQDAGKWSIADKTLEDTYVGLFRATGLGCYPFESFKFDREGLKLSSGKGSVCMEFLEGRIPNFILQGANLVHHYEPPPHAMLVQTGHDFSAVHKVMARDHKAQLSFPADLFAFECDVETCDQLLKECFTGLTLPTAEARAAARYESTSVPAWLKRTFDETLKNRRDNAFAEFRTLDREGSRRYSAFVSGDWDNPGFFGTREGVYLEYNDWGLLGGWEVVFGVGVKRFDLPDQLGGPIYGYFSEATVKSTDPYELERHEDTESRWFEVESVKGEVDLATDIPEELHGNVEFGLRLKQKLTELPFFIISNADRRSTKDQPKPIVVNAIEVDGEERTWVQTGAISGRVVLKQEMPADSHIKVRMDWKSSTLLKLTPSYSYMPRGGWMPFVSFGDVIDQFDLILRSPAEYDILGIGHKAEEHVEGKIRVSRWTSPSPVNFPTVIFGRYREDKPKFEAKKLDGTVIPIEVHVDDVSFGDWGIRPDALRPIADQAANSINLYAALSGLDYPFSELNLVNDPLGFLYGQAPSSIIYLGSGVFRGEAYLAQLDYGPPDHEPVFKDSTSIAKFLKSVVAHEVGHQWWGNRIANANGRNYWFVESLAEYFSAIYLEAVYGWNEYQEQVDEWRRNILNSEMKGSVQNASTLQGAEEGSYQAAVYSKGPYAFHMLRETFKGPGPRGRDGADKRFFDFLTAFSKELNDKREIVTLDMQRAAEKALGGVDPNGKPYNVDLGWFFDQWIRGSGIPQYAFNYTVRQAEEGSFIIEGTIRQRVRLGTSDDVMDGTTYRGVVEVTVKGKGGPFSSRVVVNGPETKVTLKVPVKPTDVMLNEHGEMLAHNTLYNQGW